MIRLSFIVVAFITGCAIAPQQAPPLAFVPAQDSRSRPPAVALEREIRFYTDEQGNVWDDRGRRQEKPPAAITR